MVATNPIKRIAVLDKDVCIKDKCGYTCIKVCPVNKMGEDCIALEKNNPIPIIQETSCIGCGICVKRCPVSAINIINLTKDLGAPSYSYGLNSFRLYGFPLPSDKAVTAYIGRNGIGKTTAINLLIKKLIPNFGDYSEKLEWDTILTKLPITIASYFKKIEKLQLSLKPQNIELIRAFKGTVKEFLKVQKIPAIILTKWNLNISDRQLKDLSGGELQKLAIAIASEKKADFYFFDEPTNYLDITERLKTAIHLKNFAEKHKLVVVDHDLTILDYMADYVYVFFGEESVYGASSSLKSARTGINEYLEGYLKSENLRFRNYEIKFSSYSPSRKKEKAVFSYPDLEKTFSSFNVKIKGGSVGEDEIVGIVGRNGLGKTLFIKMLAGVLKPDNINLNLLNKISYKKQYLEASSVIVKELFSTIVDKAILDRSKEVLNLNGAILERPLDRLSGGQLQRVAIAYSLSQDADLYLFDEPSAFLDVEERLSFASLIREIASERKKPIFVIDHDIALIDRIADNLIIFKGESSKQGIALEPIHKKLALNEFLKEVNITIRRDIDTYRPKINKPDSAKDKEQRLSGHYFEE